MTGLERASTDRQTTEHTQPRSDSQGRAIPTADVITAASDVTAGHYPGQPQRQQRGTEYQCADSQSGHTVESTDHRNTSAIRKIVQ